MLGMGLLSLTSCDDAMDEITSTLFDRNFSPVNFEAKSVTKESANLQWTPASGATSYVLEIFQDDSLKFEGDATLHFEGLTDEDIPFAVDGLIYDTKYSARVMAIDENDESRNSKWSEVYFRTNAQQIFKDIQNSDIGDRNVVMNWPAGEDVTRIEVRYTADDGTVTTVVKHDLTAEEIENGQALIEGLEPSTKYQVLLYNGEKERGSKIFTTIADLNGATIVRASDDLKTLLSEAADGQVFALLPGTFQISGTEGGTSAVAITKNIEIKGVYPTEQPVIQGRFEINGGASVVIDNIILDGSTNETTDQAFNFKDETLYGKLVVSNSEIKNFGKGVYYVNVAATIGELTFRNCLIHDIMCDGGDMFDCRKGRIDALNFIGCTIYNSCAARDMIRMDDASALGGTPVITVDKCTINGVCNSSSKRLLYVRYVGNVINFTNNIVSNTNGIWSNQSKTSEPNFTNNNYFNTPNLNVIVEKANLFADSKGANNNPEYVNAAAGNFKVGNESVVKLGVGDPRWLE